MAYSVVSRSVEYLGSARPGETAQSVMKRIDRVIELLQTPQVQADVFAIYEVNGGQVFGKVQPAFPGYTWQTPMAVARNASSWGAASPIRS